MNKTLIIIKQLLNTFALLSPVVVTAWSIIILTQLYVASPDIPKGIFIAFWIVGCCLIFIKSLSINWIWFVKEKEGEQ